MGERLEELSRQLARSSSHACPEEYIRQTLLAHGFFCHQKSGSPRNPGTGETAKKKEKPGCGISEEDKRKTTQLISRCVEGKEYHTLKEPRGLFRVPRKQPCEESQVLWPAEVECVTLPPKFSAALKSKPQPFYRPEAEVLSPKIRSGEGGTVVYRNLPGHEKFFTHARAGLSHGTYRTPSQRSEGTTLQFESRFESGNLGKAVQVGRWDYELYLRFDLYTNKHTQWFFFSVRNMRPGQTYRFTIVNLYKAGSLYNEGMQPVMFSEKDAYTRGTGWHRVGHSIKYFKTPLRRTDTRQEAHYYGLTWSFTFQHREDTCYFAHSHPYTFTDLQNYLQAISSDPVRAKFCKQRTLCRTIAGNPVPILTITSPVHSLEENKAKRAVVVTARVHPGETNGSWMMKGLLDFLTGPLPDAQILRDIFVFKVVPMLNPDGVIVGNYRCSLAGRDLNRNYRSKMKDSYPTVWHTKAMVKRLMEEREVVLYCDLHGHSRKQNVFIYGCDDLSDPLSRLQTRVFPRMLSKNAPCKFSYKSSKFNVHKSKEGTGRVVMWREMGIRNSYTMEATFCGSVLGKLKGLQFSLTQLEEMGYHLCDTLLDYCDPDPSKVEQILGELREEYRQSILIKLSALGREVPPGVDPLDLAGDPDLLSEIESSDGGSDSSESDGPPVHLSARKRRKKKKLKSRKERNKHKALLKMTHHKNPPQHPSLPSVMTTQSSSLPVPDEGAGPSHHPSLNDITPFRYSPIDTARNGGIPIFIQERLEERQKRRSDLGDSTEHLPDEVDPVEAIAMEYLRQGLDPGPLHETVLTSPLGSTSLLPRPSCPMSISALPLYEGGGGRRGSQGSLPHLPTESMAPMLSDSHSSGAFTSQYLVTHLKDVIAGPNTSLSSSTSATSNTRNLANLSRLFRQIRPHLLSAIGRDKPHPLLPPPLPTANSHSELQGQLEPEGGKERGEEGRSVTKVKFHFVERTSLPADPSESVRENPRLVSDTPARTKLSRNNNAVPKTNHNRVPKKNTGSQLLGNAGSSPSSRDLCSGSQSSGEVPLTSGELPLSSGEAPLTSGETLFSSWESFSQPVRMAEREPRTDTLAVRVLCKDKSTSQDSEDRGGGRGGGGRGGGGRGGGEGGGEGGGGVGEARMSSRVSHSLSAPSPSLNTSLPPPLPPHQAQESVTSHKQTKHRERRRKGRREGRREAEERGKGEEPIRRKLFREQAASVSGLRQEVFHGALEDSPVPHKLPQSVSDPFPSAPHPSHPSQGTSPHVGGVGVEVCSVRGGGVEMDQRPATSAERYTPLTATTRMLSSKPPSRYGSRPAGEGVVPVTVSLMLSGWVRSRPSTHHTSHRPAALRHYTKKHLLS